MPFLLGFDIGGTKCAVILGQNEGDELRILRRVAFATPAGPRATLDRLEQAARELLAETNASPLALGMSCGGPLDSRRGVILGPPNLPGWDRVEIVAHFARRLGLPARVENDANACALAEWKWGAGRGARSLVFLTFGTGMGAGLILDGRLYAGACDLAGEVGHLRLAEDGPEGYGKRGSFEGFCSGGGIARLARERGFGGAGVTAREVFEAAHAGDPEAREIVRLCGDKLGRGLAVLVDVLNPERIVIGSIFARQEALLRPAMEAALRAEALPAALAACRVVPAALGEQIGDYAALSVAASLLP